MAEQLDLSRPIGRPSDQRRLIEGILSGTLGVDETTWLEWKSQVDWNDAVDVAIKVARHVIGFANRDPVESQAFVGGEAYLVLLHDPAQPSSTRIDPADVENKVSPYLGTDGPQWSMSYVDLKGSRSLVFTVVPPRAGDHIHVLRKQADKYPNGAVFVRRPGRTDQANATDIRRLEERAKAAASQIALEVGARPATLQRLSLEEGIDAFVKAESDRLLGPLVADEYRVGGGQQSALETLMSIGRGLPAEYRERRKPSEFRAQVEKYLLDIAAAYAESGHHMAALKGLGVVELRVTNPSARNLLEVEVELFLPTGIVASRGRSDEPRHKPDAPTLWGSDTVLQSVVRSASNTSWAVPSVLSGLAGPGVWHLATVDGLRFEAFDLRPYKHHRLPSVHLFCAGPGAGTRVELSWRATAQNVDNRAEGLLTFGIVDPALTLKDLLAVSRVS